jgi:hypothetical protein
VIEDGEVFLCTYNDEPIVAEEEYDDDADNDDDSPELYIENIGWTTVVIEDRKVKTILYKNKNIVVRMMSPDKNQVYVDLEEIGGLTWVMIEDGKAKTILYKYEAVVIRNISKDENNIEVYIKEVG